MAQALVGLAGANGDLGFRIAKALVGRGAGVRALLRPAASQSDRAKLTAIGVEPVEADPLNGSAMADACRGAECVVSALNGLREVIIDRQTVLLNAAVAAGVSRFISSDYCLDYTGTEPGKNRNLDLRREFMALADKAPIRVTAIFNGAFMDMMGGEMPIVQPRIHRVLFWGRSEQKLDFTTKDDVAAFTAAAALDAEAPRILRIAGDSQSPTDIAKTLSDLTGENYRTLRAGGMGALETMIRIGKLFAKPDAVFPPYQGMQYMRDMMSGRGQLATLDNTRYSGLTWRTLREHLASLGLRS